MIRDECRLLCWLLLVVGGLLVVVGWLVILPCCDVFTPLGYPAGQGEQVVAGAVDTLPAAQAIQL